MDWTQVLHAFVNDKTVQTVAILVVVDFVLGVTAAVKTGQFQFGWLHGFLYTDVLAKLVPFFGIYAATKVGASNAWFETLRDAVFATITAAMAASILGSLKDLGFNALPSALTSSSKDPTSVN